MIAQSIDPGETVIFSFASPVSNVNIDCYVLADSTVTLTGFDASGASRTVTVSGSRIPVRCSISPEPSILIRSPE